MIGTPTVTVIGAGALGLCTAHHLVERGVEAVTVVDAGYVAGASSGRSVGIVETQYLDPLAIELRVWSKRFFDALERDHGLRIVRNGYARTGHTEADLEAFAASVELQRELGVADATVLDRDGVQALVPDLDTSDIAGALYGPSDGYLDGHLYCTLLADWLAERGVSLLVATPVEGHALGGDGRHVLSTPRGELVSDVVVNAAGGAAGEIGTLLGSPVALTPERHQALHVRLQGELGYRMTSLMDYIPASGELGLYVRDDGPGRLVAGLHTEETGNDHDELEFTELVAERFAARLPGLGDAQLGDAWSGIYPISPHGHPVVGAHPGRPTIVTVAGAGGSGIQTSPALGALGADWVLHGEPRVLPAAALAP